MFLYENDFHQEYSKDRQTFKMEAKRMRYSTSSSALESEKLDLKIWQNLQLSKCYEDNYINRLLESTRSYIVASEELSSPSSSLIVENQAISTAIHTFGLKKPASYDSFEDNTSDESNLPSTSSQSSCVAGSSSTLESEAINFAIESYGLSKN